jgi:multicomponent Na+:H+ antiporter subunit C
MSANLTLILVAGVLVATGVHLIFERALSRVILGIVLASNGVGVLYLAAGGAAGGAPFVGARPAEEMSDPLPQAMVLTAIVISLASVAFVLSLAYRQWRLTGSDDVPDDAEDELIRSLAQADQTSSTYDPETESTSLADEEDATA